MYKKGEKIYSSKPKIVDFATGTDKEIAAMLRAHYSGLINITDYWHVGDTRVMHLSAMEATPPYANESHVEQDMAMVIIGIEHDDLKEQIGTKTKAAITLQCKELLGNNGNGELGYMWGTNKTTVYKDNYSNNPRRTWLNATFVNSLPTEIQALVKTVIKKNLANHIDDTLGPNTEDKAFFTSYTEMFGNAIDSLYMRGNTPNNEEGEQYPYYNSNDNRKKSSNNNGIVNNVYKQWCLRSPSTYDGANWIYVYTDGTPVREGTNNLRGISPAFCL